MPDPYGITQVDIPGVMNAVQTSQQNRLQQLLLQQHISAAERAAERENRFNMVLARLVPSADGASPGKTGTASAVGAYGGTPATTLPSPTMPVSPASVAPVGVSGAVGAYGAPSPAATPPAPSSAATAAAPATPAPTTAAADPSLRMDPNAARELLTLNPAEAAPIITQLRTLDDDRIHRLAAAETYLAHFGQHLLQNVPEAQWRQELQARTPDLLAHGITQEQIQGFELSRRNIAYRTGQALDMLQMVEQAHPHYMNVTQGGSVINPEETDPATGQPRVVYETPTVTGPNGEPFARPPGMSAVHPRPLTDEEMRAREGGAPPPNAAGTFPAQGVW